MILLIRHCTPNIDYSKCDYETALLRLHEYNSTTNLKLNEIKELSSKIGHLINPGDIKIFCSSSPRASITADHLFPEVVNIIKSDQFVEFDLSIFYIPFLRFGIKTWFFISRILWFMGLLKTDRNFWQERKRADSCTELLDSYAQTSKVALVAHGLLNSFIERRLKKKGWHRTHYYKNGCFSIKVLKHA